MEQDKAREPPHGSRAGRTRSVHEPGSGTHEDPDAYALPIEIWKIILAELPPTCAGISRWVCRDWRGAIAGLRFEGAWQGPDGAGGPWPLAEEGGLVLLDSWVWSKSQCVCLPGRGIGLMPVRAKRMYRTRGSPCDPCDLADMTPGTAATASSNALACAILGGHTALARWMRERGCPWDVRAGQAAAYRGDTDCLHWLQSNGCSCDATVCAAAAAGGRIDALRWLLERGCPWDASTAASAARAGRRDVLDWAYQHGCPLDASVGAAAAGAGHLDALEWVVERWPSRTLPPCNGWLEAAAREGHVHVLDWIDSRMRTSQPGVARRVTPFGLLYQAASGGHVAALQWLHDHGHGMDQGAMMAAVNNGHLSALRWFVDNGCPLFPEVQAAAARSGRFDILRWARETGCPWDERVCSAAVKAQRPDILIWAHEENGCPANDVTIAEAAESPIADLREWAARVSRRRPAEPGRSGVAIRRRPVLVRSGADAAAEPVTDPADADGLEEAERGGERERAFAGVATDPDHERQEGRGIRLGGSSGTPLRTAVGTSVPYGCRDAYGHGDLVAPVERGTCVAGGEPESVSRAKEEEEEEESARSRYVTEAELRAIAQRGDNVLAVHVYAPQYDEASSRKLAMVRDVGARLGLPVVCVARDDAHCVASFHCGCALQQPTATLVTPAGAVPFYGVPSTMEEELTKFASSIAGPGELRLQRRWSAYLNRGPAARPALPPRTLPAGLWARVMTHVPPAYLLPARHVCGLWRRLVDSCAPLCCRARSHSEEVSAFVRDGHVKLFEWAADRLGARPHAAACASAAQHGRLAVLVALRERAWPWDDAVTEWAARRGDSEMLRWAQARGCLWTQAVCAWAALRGDLEMLKWAQGRGCPCGPTVLLSAAAEGHAHVVEWLHREVVRCDALTATAAASHARADLLAWMLDDGCPHDERVMAAAASSGSVDVMIALRGRGCPWDATAVASAAGNGHARAVRWLVRAGCPVDERACAGAAMANRVDLLEWLRATGCAWDATTTATAAVRGSIDALTWALCHGCPWDGEVYTRIGCVSRDAVERCLDMLRINVSDRGVCASPISERGLSFYAGS